MNRFLALFAVLAMVSSFAYADVSFSSATVTPSTVQPGVTGSMSFTITNTDTTSSVNALTLYPSGSGFEFPSAQISVGTIGTSGSSTVTIPFKVLDSAVARVYTVEVAAYWNIGTSGVSGYKKISVPVTVSNPSVFQVAAEQVSSGVGEDFMLKARIKNTAGSAYDARVTVNSTYFILRDVSQLGIGNLVEDQEVEFELPLTTTTSIPPGTYSVPVIITYRDDLSSSQQESIFIGPVKIVKGVVDFLVNAETDDTIAPGEKVTLSVDVANNGNKKAYSTKVSISSVSTDFVALGPSEKFLGDVAIGDNISIDFDVGISSSATPGYYQLTVKLDYINEQGETQASINKVVGLEVEGKPEVSIITSTSPAPIGAGSKYSLSIQVSNIGTTNLRALSVYVDSEAFEMLDSPYNFIGTLSLDDYSTAQYEVYTPSGIAPGDYPVDVRMEFMDAYNQKHVMTQTGYVTIASPGVLAISGGATGGLDLVTTLVVVAVLAVIAYFAYKRFIKKK